MICMDQIKTEQIKTVCVYCGSGAGSSPRFVEAAQALGKAFAENNIRLVYGGGSVGLMGAIAKSTLDHGGSVTGIIPDFLRSREHMLTRVQEMIVTPDMHERKRLMFEHSDAFVALPGGAGTLEELFEVYTWAQLGLHQKPCGLLNVEGYYDGIADFLAHAVSERFLREETRELLMIETDAALLIERLHTFEPQAVVPKWIDREET